MSDDLEALLHGWESYYVIVGSSAAALTGLMFVVIALMADHAKLVSSPIIGTFSTPNVVHFCVVLMVSAVLSAPWKTLSGLPWSLGAAGVGGLIYTGIVLRRALAQQDYHPVLEDWFFHVVFPMTAYAAIAVSATLFGQHAEIGLFVIGAATLLLLFVGIHNAWDSVTYVTVEQQNRAADEESKAK